MERAAELLEVDESTLAPFDTIDPFNGNTFRGHLCRQSDHRYGALVISHVNGEPAEQVVYCTPKLRYPFERQSKADEERRYRWPPFVQVRIYEKLDGTNVCQYPYRDAAGERFVTYKTRLTPVLGESRFGDFLGMWRELLAERERWGIEAPAEVESAARSYEMYGYRNHVLVRYEEPLCARLLFLVEQRDARVLVPPRLDVEPVAEASSGADLTAIYEAMREQAQAQNRKTVNASGDEEVEGTEGFVFYVLTTEGRWEMFKAKPEMVEASHWATGAIPESVIMPTARNALESCDALTVDVVEDLLREEFAPHQVGKSRRRIERCIAAVLARVELHERVRLAYQLSGLDWAIDGRGDVMRALSSSFDRGEMRTVFTALRELGIAT